MDKVIQTYQLTKKFKKSMAVDQLNFSLYEGEICALIGKNGAGKSTFFKMLAGQVLPTFGKIELFGKAEKELAEAKKRMSFIIEEPEFFPDFTAEQNMEYFRLQRGIPEKRRIDEVLAIVGLKKNEKVFAEYSMGMRQRLGLALCLLSSPDCLVLDEPINGLDAQGINEIRRLLLKLNQEKQITILISSHILSELQLLATRFVFINQGKIVEDVSREELMKKSKKQIKVKVDKPAQAAELLERSYPDIIFSVVPGNYLLIQNHIEDSAEINRLMIGYGIKVFEFQVERLNLEDYFLDLVEVMDK
ncbi:ATP-binding cassette domain-containing protein [Enterococcus sp. AZ109]|uniref:ATP-binding cassette domain-containing protein n=1 Tax=Enterococcus sp. AZ109 TaxID=2774634 RepID=UPI003F1FF255